MGSNAPNIRRLKRRRTIEPLIAALRYEDKVLDTADQVSDLGVPVRCEAAEALGELGDPDGIEAVIAAAVADPDDRVRKAAVSAIAATLEGVERPVKADQARDGEGTTPASAQHRFSRVQLARTLLIAGDDKLIDSHRELLLDIFGAEPGNDLGDVIVREMVQALADRRPHVVRRAVELIVAHAGDHIEIVLPALRDPVRAAWAARALGEIRNNRALGPLVAAMRSADAEVRRACIWALGEMADSRAVATLMAATSDDDYDVRRGALEALDKLGSIAVIGGVARALSTLRDLPWTTPEVPYASPAAIALFARLPSKPALGGRDSALAEVGLSGEDDERVIVAAQSDADTTAADQPEVAVLDAPPGQPIAVSASDGTMLHAELFGEAGAPTIVLIHGRMMALRLWTHQIRHLAEDFRVITYDLRGHGRSEPARSGDYSFAAWGDDLEAVLATCVEDGARVTVAGHSLGAASILAWAQRYDVERRVSAAALLHPGLGDVLIEHLLGRLARPTSPIGVRGYHDAVIRHAVLGPCAGEAEVAFFREMLVQCPPDVRAKCAISFAHEEIENALPRLAVPTLVIAGELDRLAPPEDARTVAGMLPGLAALVELPETGHLGPLERPKEVTRQLRMLAGAGEADTAAA